MSTTTHHPFSPRLRDAVQDALSRHGSEMETETFLAVLEEISGSLATLSQGEQEFLIKEAGVPAEHFAPENISTAQLGIQLHLERANARAADGLTTTEVAALLKMAPSNVRRAASNCELYVSTLRRNRELLFPRWQFTGARILPHLREVLQAFVVPMHPLDVEAFMTSPREELGGRTGVEWLGSGGDPDSLARLASDEGRL